MPDWAINPPIWVFALYFLGGYFFGTIQSAFFIGKIFGKIDIREHGSGNAGATNTYRVLGFRYGLLVLFFDLLKTMIPIIILYAVVFGINPWGLEANQYIYGLIVGVGVFFGHCFPFWLKFKGGKGVACSIGILLMFDPRFIPIVLSIALAIVFLTRFISLSSITGYISWGAITTFYYSEYLEIVITLWVLCVIGVILHHKNIRWLLNGTEKRFSFKSKKNGT